MPRQRDCLALGSLSSLQSGTGSLMRSLRSSLFWDITTGLMNSCKAVKIEDIKTGHFNRHLLWEQHLCDLCWTANGKRQPWSLHLYYLFTFLYLGYVIQCTYFLSITLKSLQLFYFCVEENPCSATDVWSCDSLHCLKA